MACVCVCVCVVCSLQARQTQSREITADRRMLIADNREIDGGAGYIRGRNNEAVKFIKLIMRCVSGCV